MLEGKGGPMDSDTFDDDPMDVDHGGNGLSWPVLEKIRKEAGMGYFSEFGLNSHQISSYNYFVEHDLPEIAQSLGEIIVQPDYDPSKKQSGEAWRYASITFGRIRLEPPSFWVGSNDIESVRLTPKHARLQNMTYSSKMMVEMTVQIYTLVKRDNAKTGEESQGKNVLLEEKKEVLFGRLPVMVNSNCCYLRDAGRNDCMFDSGGYFLIKGMEKIFIAQEQRCLTRVWVTDRPNWKASYITENKRRRVYVELEDSSKSGDFTGGRYVSFSFMFAKLPVWVMFFALGITSDKEVYEIINIDDDCGESIKNIIILTIKESDEKYEGFRNVETAREKFDGLVRGSKFPPSESFAQYIEKFLFPGVNGNRQKALFLGYMVKCLLHTFCGKRKMDNKDDFRNKRLDLAGELLARELRAHIGHAQKRMTKALQKHLSPDMELHLERYFDSSIITNGLTRAFSTGNWCHPYRRSERISGIVSTLRRTNPLQMISDLRKTRQQVAYAGKAGDARYPNPSYWGKLCFLSTPDGENCGLVKNLAATAIVSTPVLDPLVDKMVSCGMNKLEVLDLQSIHSMCKVFLNGDWVGVCKDPSLFIKSFRIQRRAQDINYQVEIKSDVHQNEVRVFSDAGRILRPLLVLDNLKKIGAKTVSYSFRTLMNLGIVEFIGVEEEEDCRAAWGIRHLFDEEKGHKYSKGKDQCPRGPKYTHCELDTSFLLGLSCGIIPFANHNFARRVLYESEKHSQQAIGYSTTNPNIRVDTLSHQLFYPQRPLFRTFLADCVGRTDYPFGRKEHVSRPEFFNGQNAIVAVNVHLGYNQEDSLVLNRSSLERGMFRTEHLRSFKADVENKDLAKRVKMREKIDFGKVQSKKGRVDSLDDDGLPYVGASLQCGDIVIGKVSESGEDHSIKLRHTEKGMVQKVVLSANDEGKNFAVVTLRQVRSPTLGDKFSSMHGQKGVVGFLESQENFPFTCQGIVPDVVINPHAFPTRQTPGQLLEAALGKGIALRGLIRYATPFSTPTIEEITKQLHGAGFQRWGAESVLNGRNGERMKSLIFMGPNFYQRLIHMAEDKVKYRNTGPVHPLTRQPVADRKRFGGVKFGEMERDCLLAHGATSNLHERLFVLSDFSEMKICTTCQRAANVILRRDSTGGRSMRGPYCAFCKSSENMVNINVPYGAKLLYQELFSIGITLKFQTEPA